MTTRRNFIKGVGAGLILSPAATYAKAAARPYLFKLGVMAGDPWPDGFVICTRLCPKPTEKHGGMTNADVNVRWEVSTTESFSNVIQSGIVTARLANAHSAKAVITGLAAGTEFYYRFSAMGDVSRTGRAMTLPVIYTEPLRIISAGCQNYETGLYGLHKKIAQLRPHYLFWSGDFIYTDSQKTSAGQPNVVRPTKFPNEAVTYEQFCSIYAIVMSDLNLQDAMASCAWLCSFDDHEVINNWWMFKDKRGDSVKQVTLFRTNGLKAWADHMPVRCAPTGPNIVAYRNFKVANLINMMVLDTRSNRTPPACNVTFSPCPEAEAPERQVLGVTQEAWVKNQLENPTTVWDTLCQQVLLSRVEYNDGHRMDAWDGSPAARYRVLGTAQGMGSNLIVLTGDIHKAMASNVYVNDTDDTIVAAEFNSSSISSGNPDAEPLGPGDVNLVQNNPNIVHMADKRGFNELTFTPESCEVKYWAIQSNRSVNSPVFVDRMCVVEAGNPGIVVDA
jgi:alkaline phosphatase D